MIYQRINTLPQKYDHLAIVRSPFFDDNGEEVSTLPYRQGEPCSSTHPKPCRIYMAPAWPGIRLGGLVGNAQRLLIVHGTLAELIKAHRKSSENIEILPIEIWNHKKRKASGDYFVINPVGVRDCIDFKESGVSPSQDLVPADRMVLCAEKIKDEPALFRPRGDIFSYFINGAITQAFKDSGFTDRNIFVSPLRIV